MKNALTNQKKTFTFTVEGVKHRFDTVEKMWDAIHILHEDGKNVDRHSIKREVKGL